MKVTIKDREALGLCNPDNIKNYLLKKGWTQQDTAVDSDDEIFSFENISIALPKQFTNSFAISKVSWILMILEQKENRSQLDIWCEITGKTLIFGKNQN